MEGEMYLDPFHVLVQKLMIFKQNCFKELRTESIWKCLSISLGMFMFTNGTCITRRDLNVL